MPHASKPKLDKATRDREEHARFLETAKEVGADESPQAFERAFKRIVRAPKVKEAREASKKTK
jgi:hypothetical protein